MQEKNNRKKRFLLNVKKDIPLYYSQKEEILTIAYDYEDEATRTNKDYLEQIQIAIEQFNNLGFAKLVYRPAPEIILYPNCPIEEISLRKKYLNQVIFGSLNSSFPYLAVTNYISPIEDYVSAMQAYFNITVTSMSAFSWIKGNTQHSDFQSLGIGILLHEIFHLFGIKDLIKLNVNCTDAIYYPNITTLLKCENDNNTKSLDCINLQRINSFECEELGYENFRFTPLSLLSLQQYSRKRIEPFFSLNETRISEILTQYKFTADLQKDYFDLLKSYQGQVHLITYQDFSALAQAIYSIAADSMLGRVFNVPYYYLIKGLYRPLADEDRFDRLISAFREAENFNYPILAQEALSLTFFKDSVFAIDLAKKLKVVSLTTAPVRCCAKQPLQFKGSLLVSNDCILTGASQAVGNFTFNIVLSNSLTEINRFIGLNIKEKSEPLNTILLGKRSVVHTLTKNSSLNLITLCHAVAIPEGHDINCNSFDLPESLFLAKCTVSKINSEKNYNFTINFFNDAVNKTCSLQLLAASDSAFTENLIMRNSDVFINKPLELNNESNINSYYASYAHEEYGLSINMVANSVHFMDDNLHYMQQFNYLLTIPLLHGVFEGCIDNMALSSLVKTILKLLPRIGLVSINYLSTLQFPFLFFYSLLESFVGGYLKAKNNDRFRQAANLFLFLLVAELEYGFSNLWELADKPQFWPALTDRFNQLFAQMLWAPTVKMTGYLLGVSITDCWAKSAIPEENNETNVAANTAEVGLGCRLSFFNSLTTAKNTVFSGKIGRMPRLFYNHFSSQHEEGDRFNRREIFQNPVNQSNN